MNCTICKSNHTSLSIETKDFSISKETFSIYECLNCKNFFTADAPSETEISPYYESEDYVSHSDTKKGFIHGLYHKVRNINLSLKLKLIQKHHTGKKLLDYGCGTGEFLSYINERGYTTQGVEPSPTASENAAKKGIKTIEPNQLSTLPDNYYDVITLWHVLEHVHDLEVTLNHLRNKLSDQGTMLIAVPNIESYDSNFYQHHWAALDVPRHLYHFTKTGMSNCLTNSSLKVIGIKGMVFDSFYVSLLSEKYKGSLPGILQPIRAFLIGLISNMKSTKNHSSLIYIIKKK